MTIRTIRDDIYERYPKLFELVNKQFPGDTRGSEAFKFALQLYLYSLPNWEVAIDGWTLFNVVKETPKVLRAVGIVEVLPSGELPIDAEFSFIDGSIEYRILVGSDDQVWSSLTNSKRWNTVYLYATEGSEPEWNWEQVVTGSLAE